MRRVKGTGSIYQRSDGLWIARVTVCKAPRKRMVFSSKDRATAEKKLQDWLEANRPDLAAVDPLQARGRALHMKLARDLGTHTRAQWEAKQTEQGHLCHYCKRPVGVGGMKDHYVPVSRGGSDGIENIVLACWDCNAAKADAMPEDFLAWAQESGLFEAAQRVTVSHHGRNLRLSPQMVALMKVPKGQRMAWLERQRLKRGRQWT